MCHVSGICVKEKNTAYLYVNKLLNLEKQSKIYFHGNGNNFMCL